MLACLWMAAAFACLFFNTAAAQSFSISLPKLTKLYDRLYPERTGVAAWDTTGVVDLGVLELGNQEYEVPNFLTHDFKRTTTRTEFSAVGDYEVTFEYPPVYSLARRDTTIGAFTMPKAREFGTIPGLETRLRPMNVVIEDVRRESLREVWRENTREYIMSRQRNQRAGKGGITIDIPIPMPRQLESIFGPAEKTHINITGREEITFAGETRVVKPFIGVEGRQKQSLFPSLDMKQTLDVRLTGTIGDKVNVQVDHSSESLSDDANRIRLNYTGYEDDVIQLIELGNTSLSLPGSQLVNVSTQSKGLFGVKVLAQLGATDITFIASKQQGETSSASFSPTTGSIGSTEKRTIRDLDYVKNKYFFFNPNGDGALPDANTLDVYKQLKGIEVNELGADGVAGRAFIDSTGDGTSINTAVAPLASGNIPSAVSEKGWFTRLVPGTDYSYVVDAANDKDIIGIELVNPISDDEQRTLAVTYTTVDGDQVGGQKYSQLWGGAGTFPRPPVPNEPAEKDTLVLKIIKNRTPRPSGEFAHQWNFMMRNIYNLGLSNIDRETFSLQIEDNFDLRLDRTVPDTLSNFPYIQIFGLDQYDQSGNPVPDHIVDLTSGLIDLRNGILVFPTLTPFAPPDDLVRQWTGGGFSFEDTTFGVVDGQPRFYHQWEVADAMYRTRPNAADFPNLHQYNIVVEAVSTSKTFRINALNIIENSEVVTVDGTKLNRGTDYDIDYVTGEINLKGDILSQLNPASRINIDYEYKPFGGGGSSSLVGFSTSSKIGENVRLGSTFLYESKNVPAEKPRVGEEPTRAVVGSVNGSIQHQSEFLTRLANKLPLVDTDAPSTINLNGEIAMSIPDPNTRGEAYIDDFEGVEDSDRISMSRRTWQMGSLPLDPGVVLGSKRDVDTRLGFLWYNVEPEIALRKRDLNPELDERENSLLTALDIELDPGYSTDPVDSSQWAGVMTGFAGGGLDLTQGQFIEVWVNDFKPNPFNRGGKLHIDLGYIDENFFEPEKDEFNDEDRGKDGFAAAYDDTGLDGVFDADEDSVYAGGSPDDPHGDDIDLSRINGRFTKVNGTEANHTYDTEDLDRSGERETLDAYYEYVIDLSDSAVVDIREQFPGYNGWVNEHRNDSWRLYRIKLSDAKVLTRTGVQPALDQITHMRIWFDHVSDVVTNNPDEPGARRIQVAELKVVGNRWEEDGIRDLSDELLPDTLMTTTEFALGVISTKSDPGVYVPPIRPNVQNEVADKETSLFLRYDNLEDETQVRILKRFQGNGLDLSQYRDLNFWVHTDRLDADLEYYFRLGTNENNYYEVAVPLTPKYFPGGGWGRVLTKLEYLTYLKLEADSLSTGSAPDEIEDRAYPIKMVGTPSLFSVRFLYAGIRNKGTSGAIHSGELWLDDIYVGDVRRDIDFAQRINGSVNVGGGILSLSGGWTRTGPDFRGLRQSRGRGTLDEAWNVNAKTALQHFIPIFGFNIPLSGSYSKTTSKPKFVPNSDTEISSDALRDSLSTVAISQGFSTSLSKRGSKNVFLKYTVDKISSNFSYNRTRRHAPASADTSTSMNGTLGYQINWTGKKDIKLYKKIRLRWWLNSLDVRTTATRRTLRRWRFIGNDYKRDPYSFSAGLNNTGSVNYQPMKSISSTFSMGIERDLRLPHEWYGVDVGTEIRRNHNFQVNYRPPPIKYIKELSPDINLATAYTEDNSPQVRRPGDSRNTRNVTANRSASLSVRYDIGKTFRSIFNRLGMDLKSPEEREREARRSQAAGAARAGGADTTTAPADTTSGPRADPKLALRKIGQILSDLRRINAKVTHKNNSAYQRILGRPDLMYQFGFQKESGVMGQEGPANKPDRYGETLTLNADTGVQLTENIDVATRYFRSISDTDFRTSQSRAVSTSFPDFQVSWKGLEQFGLFRPFFKTTQANINWKQSTQESGRKGKDPDNTQTTLSLAPSLLFTWRNDIKSTLSASYNKRTSETGGSKTEATDLNVNLDFKKSFRGGAGFKLPIPFFSKEVKWSSTLDTSLGLSYSRTGGKRYTEGVDFSEPIPSTSSIRVNPTVAYRFSDSLSGQAFVQYGRSYNEASDQTITTVRVGVTAVFTF